MSENHKGPHCNGLCEGAAYLIKIAELEQELSEVTQQRDSWYTDFNAQIAINDRNSKFWQKANASLKEQVRVLEANISQRECYQRGFKAGRGGDMSKMYSHQDACQPYRDKIAELEQELKEIGDQYTEEVDALVAVEKENARLKEQLGLQTAAKQEAYREIRVMQGEIDRLKEQVRVRGERMEQLYSYIFEVDSPVEGCDLHDWFDDNGKVLDE